MRISTKPGYRVPTIGNYHEVRLDEFSFEEIREYLRHKGELAADADLTGWDDTGGILIEQADVSRIATLALCGQKESAREWLIDFVSNAIGRPL